MGIWTPHLENGDLDSILAAAWFCNSYGVDTISMGNVLGFLADCLERGILCPDDIGSADFGFGNVRDVPDLIRLTALKEGIGSLLALGVKRAAQRLGKRQKASQHMSKVWKCQDMIHEAQKEWDLGTQRRRGCMS